MVTHPSTNRARRRVTSLIWPTSLPTAPNRHLRFNFLLTAVHDINLVAYKYSKCMTKLTILYISEYLFAVQFIAHITVTVYACVNTAENITIVNQPWSQSSRTLELRRCTTVGTELCSCLLSDVTGFNRCLIVLMRSVISLSVISLSVWMSPCLSFHSLFVDFAFVFLKTSSGREGSSGHVYHGHQKSLGY